MTALVKEMLRIGRRVQLAEAQTSRIAWSGSSAAVAVALRLDLSQNMAAVESCSGAAVCCTYMAAESQQIVHPSLPPSFQD